MKNKELQAVKAALYAMQFSTYGEIKAVADADSKIDAATQAAQVKYNEVFAANKIKTANGRYDISPEHKLFAKVEMELQAKGNEESGIDIAFLTPEQFERAIATREPIPTELLTIAVKYLVKS
ncbi:hypothetical protein E2P86_08640 [Sphingobacterium psychroaquaticum]|uniref:hypothetical protein n=1 Tax=Sphingobacterium psychroaquaticum TaxID=561061 RepID=UPI00106A45C8|nr:hypothetical protein [Sphingobacterium psychroaquaticum]QBQ41220.1 hypothetical protein E2P86_08640 [Sphingobacterium psychroaquaticum]